MSSEHGDPEDSNPNPVRGVLGDQKKPIIAGLISAAIFLYFLDPILSFLGRVAISIGMKIFSSYLDRLYAETATGNPNFGFFFLCLFAALMSGIGTGIIARSLIPNDKENKFTIKPSIASNLLKSTKRIGIVILPLCLIVDGYIRLKTTSTFNQRITIIAPYITDQEFKELRSEFARMHSKADFDSLMGELQQIAIKNKIGLPPNRLYPY